MKLFLAVLLLLVGVTSEAKSKYGSKVKLLSKSHGYIREEKAPDYWALSPYYAAQQNGKSCSVASIAMVVNASRSASELTADDQLVTQEALLKKVNDSKWSNAVDMAMPGGGVPLDDLKTITEESLRAYGIKNFSVEVFHMDNTKLARDELHKNLLQNEKSKHDFIIANFIQGVFTGDADVGHISPVAAYDKKHKRVLIMDVDREWYEPYWVSEETFIEGMATTDKSVGHARGYIYIKLNN